MNKNKASEFTWTLDDDPHVERPSGKGERLVIIDVISDQGRLGGASVVWHAKSSSGDYHGNFTAPMYLYWTRDALIPALERDHPWLKEFKSATPERKAQLRAANKAVVVCLDGASYHFARHPVTFFDTTPSVLKGDHLAAVLVALGLDEIAANLELNVAAKRLLITQHLPLQRSAVEMLLVNP